MRSLDVRFAGPDWLALAGGSEAYALVGRARGGVVSTGTITHSGAPTPSKINEGTCPNVA